ncbi:ADP-ribosyl-[dinitrogen reductase] hydrolase [Rhodoblastus acidophilus]|uniref:ADP-ribosyl-[dinitrogen reductase] hydrolase n=1 Tax=Rhodoblastus acidophilus TaxID=1074 RepID=A0A212RTQ5_RHOAC|nr:ADP-ribosyl-[dinitrogen reductase] hydrolase [Rhodoblastus acidophilus]MCW2315425.1 ADP-ribosyl-[dinitrogen reductase] hydrolase [Rhodoblastus acidophilus]PPQ37402.1 ADP-ribosyl-[dinitrogen reductase] hydrolase [Rhodoblastus acidophilus]RAI23188.1 ADP-ribosyl-[dinitrogen reductase] hydrolase [Rhodoblastus acidophilus]SNB75916.1 ADP-ribosyl-[dinitrogen reductase] hydrolase [Rhodoblastus acidophilus]
MTLENRALACFLGFAIGDALGATVEFMTEREIAATHGVHKNIVGGGWLKLKPGAITDDTQMSLVLARSLVKIQGFDVHDIANGFAGWLRSGPLDVGNTCRRGIRRYMTHGSVEGPLSEGDGGNGAVMRVAPVALATVNQPEKGEGWAVTQGRITHHHPRSDAACVWFVRLLRHALATSDKAPLKTLAEQWVALDPAFRFANYTGQSSAYVVDTMRTVLWGFFETESFEDCLIRVVNRGGDADTTGALVGALAGAFYGMQALPKRWVKGLQRDVREEIYAITPQLLALGV